MNRGQGEIIAQCFNSCVGGCCRHVFVAVDNMDGVVGSKCQVPLPARGLLVKSNVE